MADQMRIGIPNWRPASDIDNAVAITLEDCVRFVCGMNFYQRPFRTSPIWKRGDGIDMSGRRPLIKGYFAVTR
jgi:hypothetical protein